MRVTSKIQNCLLRAGEQSNDHGQWNESINPSSHNTTRCACCCCINHAFGPNRLAQHRRCRLVGKTARHLLETVPSPRLAKQHCLLNSTGDSISNNSSSPSGATSKCAQLCMLKRQVSAKQQQCSAAALQTTAGAAPPAPPPVGKMAWSPHWRQHGHLSTVALLVKQHRRLVGKTAPSPRWQNGTVASLAKQCSRRATLHAAESHQFSEERTSVHSVLGWIQ